jgi:transcriptional regulator
MLIHPWDAAQEQAEWLDFVAAQRFGQLIASGRDRDVAVVVPTQYSVVVPTQYSLVAPKQHSPGTADGSLPEVWLHLARPNPVWAAIAENPTVLLSLAGDWAYVPAAWKAVDDEDPALGIPTTFYAAVQLVATATVVDDAAGKLEILRRQLSDLEPESGHADPAVHERRLPGIRGLRLTVTDVRSKFKYAGNLDDRHRLAIADRLAARGGSADERARQHLLRRNAPPDPE